MAKSHNDDLRRTNEQLLRRNMDLENSGSLHNHEKLQPYESRSRLEKLE